PAHYDNVVMIAPSASLVASLPYAKISDRNDFKVLDDAARIRYWQAVIDAGRRMADEFDQRLQAQQWEDVLAPF
ncbi:MAG: patatin-like phospholipase family protein, partial [Gammaproteobacteria bacterium]|nr:patatin-like phospholipase family protein [Gammaproteobacteria bacterium]